MDGDEQHAVKIAILVFQPAREMHEAFVGARRVAGAASLALPSAMRSALELLRQWRSRKSLRSLTRRRCSGAVAVTGWPLRSRMATMANCGKAYMPCVFK